MKPIFSAVPETLHEAVYAIREVKTVGFSGEFHFHRECQLSYIIKSEGKRIIGDHVDSFAADELILIGANLPHVWHNHKTDNEQPGADHAHSLSLFFDPEKLLHTLAPFGFFHNLELKLEQARRGMIFHRQSKTDIATLLLGMNEKEGFEQLILFTKILDVLSKTEEYNLLSDDINSYDQQDDTRKINQIFRYVFSNFHTNISLDEAAELVQMSKPAFCRYFRHRTKKTFMEFVNEVRLRHACHLMADDQFGISGLAYASGFNSISNFNRLFQQTFGLAPMAYRRRLNKSF